MSGSVRASLRHPLRTKVSRIERSENGASGEVNGTPQEFAEQTLTQNTNAVTVSPKSPKSPPAIMNANRINETWFAISDTI